MKSISWYKSLRLPKNRRQYGCFVIEGKRAVSQALSYHSDSIEELLCTNEAAPPQHSDIPIRIISAANMMSICTSKTPQGIAAIARIPPDVYTARLPDKQNVGLRILLLEHIQDPGNLGTLIRTAAAFGISGIILSDQCADPFSPKAVQSTAGSILSPWIRKNGSYISMVVELKIQGYKLIGADVHGNSDTDANVNSYMLALGNEGSGLSDDLLDICDRKIRIPVKESGAESLNVAVAGGILMFALKGYAL